MKRELITATLLAPLLAVVSLGSQRATAAQTAAPAADRILLTSNRDGTSRVYSVGVDGAPLTPLLASGPRLEAVAVSPDGQAVAYIGGRDAPEFGPLYVSRADGSRLRRLAKWTDEVGFSRNGRFLAFTTKRGIWIARSDGRSLRRLTSAADGAFDWSPNGKALVFIRVIGKEDRFGVVVKPLHGRQRVLARTGPNSDASPGEYQPLWSPNGRWIAYFNREDKQKRNGLTLIRPNGKQRHRIVIGASDEDFFEWSPDGRWVAYEDIPEIDYIRTDGAWHVISKHAAGPVSWSRDGKKLAFSLFVGQGSNLHTDLVVARGDGQQQRRLRLDVAPPVEWWVTWSPDGSRFAFAASADDDPWQIWVVNSDGSGLRRLTNDGSNGFVGWTNLAPLLPPAPALPTNERVIDVTTVATDTPIEALSADGSRVAFAPKSTLTDCRHVMVWTPGENVLHRLGNLPAPCPGTSVPVTTLALAGSRAAWLAYSTNGQDCGFELRSATLEAPVARRVSQLSEGDYGAVCKSADATHLRGDGELLVFNDEPTHPSWLVRIGMGSETCGRSLCATLRKDAAAAPVDSVSGGLIATRGPTVVNVLDGQGNLVRAFPFAPADVQAARLDGTRLVVARTFTIESYSVATGALEFSRPSPVGYALVDADDGIAVLRRTDSVILLRLNDGASFTLAPGPGPVLADLEAPGLYYSYAAAGGGRLVFVPRADLAARFGRGS